LLNHWPRCSGKLLPTIVQFIRDDGLEQQQRAAKGELEELHDNEKTLANSREDDYRKFPLSYRDGSKKVTSNGCQLQAGIGIEISFRSCILVLPFVTQ
jgi:hypothetical protein